MRFIPIERDELPVSGRPSSKSATLFNDFMESGLELSEIELDENDKTPESVRSSLDNYVVRHNLPIEVFTRAGRLFIAKSDTLPSERPKRTRKAKNADGVESVVAEPTAETVDVTEEGEYAGV